MQRRGSLCFGGESGSRDDRLFRTLVTTMIPILVLFGSLLLFRLLGNWGVPILATWKDATIFALAIMFCFTAAAHFGRMRVDIEKMVNASMSENCLQKPTC